MSPVAPRLSGKTVVVTRSAEDGAELTRGLEAEGARVLLVPTIRIVDAPEGPETEAALAQLPSYDGVILGSQNAAERLLTLARGRELDLQTSRFFVVGEKTAAFVSSHVPGARVQSPSVFRAEALVELLRTSFGAGGLAGRRFLFPRAPEGRELIIESLRAAGATVDALSLYRIESAPPPSPDLIAAIEDADVLTFMSGRTLEHWLRVLPEPVARRHLDRAKVAVIGPVAKETAERLGVRVDIVPREATVEGLIEAVADTMGGLDQ